MPAPKGNSYAKGNRGGGRPTKFNAALISQIKKACEAGFTDTDLAALLGVCETTINAWKIEHEEFSEALKSKNVADEKVEASLFRRATGYEESAVKIFCNKEGMVTEVPYVEKHAPDTTACIFWLKNRQPARWRDKQEHEHTGKDGEPFKPILNITIKK